MSIAAELLAILPPKHIPVIHTEKERRAFNAPTKAAQAEVIDVLKRHGDWMSAAAVGNARGVTGASQITVLNRLVAAGAVEIKKGKPNTYRMAQCFNPRPGFRPNDTSILTASPPRAAGNGKPAPSAATGAACLT
ncbi:MAG TPA: hypothetical protein ENO09_05850, partial [bacterium]|nr:hypothetical protein [bacterium]